MGAGAVGCWIGGCLQAAGAPVMFVGRPRVLNALRAHGLTLTDLDGGTRSLPAGALDLRESADGVPPPALVLLCVKSGATASAAAELARAVPPATLVVSMQNGLSNAGTAQAAAPALAVRAGMVPFNIAELSPGHYHRGTSGVLAAQDHARLREWQPHFAAAGVPLQLHADVAPLQWGKLLLNLNNAVNALSGLPLREQLLQRDYRLCMAALIDEALAALRAAGISPAKLTALPPAALPAVLRLPTAIFRVLAARLLRIDAKARTSMADDLSRGRATEIDALCGEVVRLARRHGTAAPVNERISELVRAWPSDPRARSGAELRAALGV
ncbi:MAG: 2-dehydropantoate 2-reductase [Burkholderiaceae bacterium]|nr:2-dehydropantoate 2-reductase [Burkholderiaceae bacterium]